MKCIKNRVFRSNELIFFVRCKRGTSELLCDKALSNGRGDRRKSLQQMGSISRTRVLMLCLLHIHQQQSQRKERRGGDGDGERGGGTQRAF